MMLSTSKLVIDAAARQEQAINEVLTFSGPLQDAIALADHFEKIRAEEYIIPETSGLSKAIRSEGILSVECYTAL